MSRSFLGTVARLAMLAATVSPATALAQGGPGGQAPRIDSTLYVRTAPPTNPIIQQMLAEGTERGQAMKLAQVLMDSIGPRLNNSPRFDAGQEWLVREYGKWGVPASRVQYGTWIKWNRGATYMDLVSPRVRTLEATILGWSPGTNGQWIEADVVTLPRDSASASTWRTNARGKFVLYSPPNPTCRMGAQLEEFGTPATVARIRNERAAAAADVRSRMLMAGGNPKVWPKEIGVAGMIGTNWSQYPGVNKIFGSPKDADNVPTVDVSCEDYNLLYRLAENNQGPKVRFFAQSENMGEQPVHNVIARIEGRELPNEYIVLSAHYDSWDGASGATDNGTGTITMMEAVRILKKIYPNPRRTIIVGHWGGEEQGLNGSRSWVADNPQIVARVHAGFNQDNGTGRIQSVSPGPTVAGPMALARYMMELPASMTGGIRLGSTGSPGTGGSDHSSFQCMKAPLYGLGGLGWDYSNSTWHTNRDTYDKVMAEDLQNNATLVAMLVYMADQDPTMINREVISSLPNNRDGTPGVWPTCPTGDRNTASSPR
jgi:carboxypeptidase Q